MNRLSSAGLILCFAAAVVMTGVPPCAAHDSKVTATTQIWRVVDPATGTTYYTQSIDASWFAGGDGLFNANGMGTVTYTPTQTPQASRIGSEDSWQAGSTVAGATAAWNGKQSGFATVSADGVHNPAPPSGMRSSKTRRPR